MRKGKQSKKHKAKLQNIGPFTVPDERKTRFSFERIDLNHGVFSLSKCNQDFWLALVETLKHWECTAIDDFLKEEHQESRHGIKFERTIEQNGFPGIDTEQLIPFQFPIGDRDLSWRAYGYISQQMFYIVWLDTEHALYKKADGSRI
jgi:hypothetical protein